MPDETKTQPTINEGHVQDHPAYARGSYSKLDQVRQQGVESILQERSGLTAGSSKAYPFAPNNSFNENQ